MTGSSNTSGGPRPACATRAGRTRPRRSAGSMAPSPRRRSRWPRSRATSSTRSGGWPGWPAAAAMASLADRLEAEALDLQRRFSEQFRLPGRVDRHGPRSLEAAGRRDRLERGALPVERDRAGRPGAGRGGRPGHDGDGLRLGPADVRRRSARLQPDRLPHRHGLAARHGDRRGRPAPLRLRRRRRGPGRRAALGGPALPGLPPAGAVLRLRPCGDRAPRSPTRSPARHRPGRPAPR